MLVKHYVFNLLQGKTDKATSLLITFSIEGFFVQ